jgi:hypothetical protein
MFIDLPNEFLQFERLCKQRPQRYNDALAGMPAEERWIDHDAFIRIAPRGSGKSTGLLRLRTLLEHERQEKCLLVALRYGKLDLAGVDVNATICLVDEFSYMRRSQFQKLCQQPWKRLIMVGSLGLFAKDMI